MCKQTASRSRHFLPDKAVSISTKATLMVALLLWAPAGVAQGNLGDLLDVGARMLSPEEFKQELVGKTLVGPSPSGGSLEVIYTISGVIEGAGTPPTSASSLLGPAKIFGRWTIDDKGRVCTTMTLAGGLGGAPFGVTLPPRCQFWLKYGDQFFLSDFDTDRRAKVLRRTVKQ